jgi:hypothetical protein
MNFSGLQHIRQAVHTLNPNHVRELGERDLYVALYAATPDDYSRLEDFLVQGLSPERRRQALSFLHRAPDPARVLDYDLAVYDESVLAPRRAVVFHADRPQRFVSSVLDHFDTRIALPLAKNFPPFRAPYITRVIRTVSRENAIFSMATALPDIVPSLVEIPWALTEFASDTAVLTANQIKMAFILAAASDREVGYREQKSEIAMLIGGAFGCRALARQVIGKIPFGGGLIPKAAIAYAATKLIGTSLERYYRIGYTYTRQEREEIYAEAFQHGQRVAGSILKKLRPDLAEKNRDFHDVKTHQSTSL